MRITNKMMTNNALYNISNNKNLLSNLEQQYSTGKKITKPSDDPIVAVRALKFRTNLTELNQYYEKNIPDALAWMDVTESALNTVNDIITSMNSYCNQGANDYPSPEDRDAIAINLEEMKGQIYQEGNTNYAGRYVFSGYKTDTSLVFNEKEEKLSYAITEPLKPESMDYVSKVVDGVNLKELDMDNLDAWDTTMPRQVETYRLKLSYDNVKDTTIQLSYKTEDDKVVNIENGMIEITPLVDKDGKPTEKLYEPDPGKIHFIPETGELIFGKELFETLNKAKEISVDYEKSEFEINDLRPEHYFDCTMTDLEHPEKEPVQYTKKDQQIQYEVNFNQKLTVNTQGSDAFTTGISRMVDEIVNAINDVKAVEDSIKDIDKRLENASLTPEQKTKLEGIKEQLDAELALKTDVMTEAFQRGLTITEQQQDIINVAVADLGGRYNRLQLTESRLSNQQVDFEDLLSQNEDADLVDIIIKYSSAETVYNSSLSAASKLVQTSLLDFL